MSRINLRNYYPHYNHDSFVDVPDEVAELLKRFRLDDEAYRLRTYRHKSYYSLDCMDGDEDKILFMASSPDEIYERKLTANQLYAAISNLPDKQAKRIYAHFFLGMSKAEIARTEGVDVNTVKDGMNRGLENMKKYFQKNL